VKFKPILGDQYSGSLAGVTASHNRGGDYFRQRKIPTNPNSTYQQAVRSAVSQLTGLWINTLTAAQRDAWDTYAANVLIPDKIGAPRNIGGVAMYVRCNVPRLQASLARVDAGPTTYNLGAYTAPAIDSIDATAGTMDLTFTNTDDWANEDDASMLVKISRGQNVTINYFKGPYRFAGSIDGDAVTPPTSPATLTLPFTVVAGQRVFIQVYVSRADGRLSAGFRDFGVAT